MNDRLHILFERTKACRGTQGLIFIDLESIEPIKLAVKQYGCTILGVNDCTLMGDIEMDMIEILVTAGKEAKAEQGAVVILLEHMETIPIDIIRVFVVTFHKAQQYSLPVAFVGTGSGVVRGLLANAALYTERMFEFIDTKNRGF